MKISVNINKINKVKFVNMGKIVAMSMLSYVDTKPEEYANMGKSANKATIQATFVIKMQKERGANMERNAGLSIYTVNPDNPNKEEKT